SSLVVNAYEIQPSSCRLSDCNSCLFFHSAHDSREVLLFTPRQLICIHAKSGLGCRHRHVSSRRSAQNQLEVFVHQRQGKLGTVIVAFYSRQLPYVSRRHHCCLGQDLQQ